MKKEKSCGAVVIKKEKGEIKFLIIKQHDNCWHFPKGHVEENETEIETAIREIKEETNIDVEVDDSFRKVITYSPKESVIKDVVFFIGSAISNDLVIDSNELLDARWVNASEVKDYFNYQDNIDVFEAAVEYLYDKGFFYDYYIPKDCKRILIMLHGFSSNMYGSTNSYIKKKIIGTNTGYISFDLPGHGSSPYIMSLEKCFEVLDKVNSFVDEKNENVEKIVLGMSFGGYLAILDVIRNPKRYYKIILRSPALKMYNCLSDFYKNETDYNKNKIFGIPVKDTFANEIKKNDLFNMNLNIDAKNILIIHGDIDDTAPLDDVLDFTKKYGGTLRIIKNAGHSFKLENLKLMYNYINDFLTKED